MFEILNVVTGPKQTVMLPATFNDDDCDQWLLPIEPMEDFSDDPFDDEY